MPETSFGPLGWKPDRMGDLQGKTFVITGTTAGTGFEAAKMLLTKGARPEVMCATEEGLAGRTLYGPTKRGEMMGPVGVCKLEDFALDQQAAAQLWDLSVEMTGFVWTGQ